MFTSASFTATARTPSAGFIPSIVGAVSFCLITLGADIVAIFAGAIGLSALAAHFQDVKLNESAAAPYVPLMFELVGAGACVAGIGLAISWFILRHHRIRRPMIVTICATLVASIPGTLSFGFIFLALLLLIPSPYNAAEFDASRLVRVAELTVAIDLVVAAVLGGLVWWWMSHVFRARNSEAGAPL